MVIPDSHKLNPRADSFSLYLNYVADKVLSNLLPKSKLEGKLHKTVKDRKAWDLITVSKDKFVMDKVTIKTQSTRKESWTRSSTAELNKR